MLFDVDALSAQDRYKSLATSIAPRPIAWITTLSRNGIVNAAPFSFFNMMGNDPPTVTIGIMPNAGRLKDTAANILETGEFIINLVFEANAEAMNLTCIDAPPEVDELDLAGLTAQPSRSVAPPRILDSPISLGCRMLTSLVTGPLQTIVIGRVICAHVDDRFQPLPRRHDGAARRRAHAGKWRISSLDRPVSPGATELGRVAGGRKMESGSSAGGPNCYEGLMSIRGAFVFRGHYSSVLDQTAFAVEPPKPREERISTPPARRWCTVLSLRQPTRTLP